jgi:hypothetical protein
MYLKTIVLSSVKYVGCFRDTAYQESLHLEQLYCKELSNW